MFAFITIGTNNLKKSSLFYSKILKPLKIKKVLSHNRYFGFAKKETPKKIELYLIRPHNKKKATIGNGSMTGFLMNSEDEVDAIHAKAISLGATDEGEPGRRTKNFYGAYVRDLDGNKLVFYI